MTEKDKRQEETNSDETDRNREGPRVRKTRAGKTQTRDRGERDTERQSRGDTGGLGDRQGQRDVGSQRGTCWRWERGVGRAPPREGSRSRFSGDQEGREVQQTEAAEKEVLEAAGKRKKGGPERLEGSREAGGVVERVEGEEEAREEGETVRGQRPWG